MMTTAQRILVPVENEVITREQGVRLLAESDPNIVLDAQPGPTAAQVTA
jgi:hypothetical protein